MVHNLRLVISIAYQYGPASVNILDLFQEGSVGLMEAVKRWEPTGPRFGTYAAYWIRACAALPDDQRAPHPRGQHPRRAQAVLPPGERAAEAAGRRHRRDAQAAGGQAGRDEKDLDEVRAHLDSREVRSTRAPRRRDEAYALSERIVGRRRSRPRSRRRAPSSPSTMQKLVAGFRDGLKDDRERAVWHEHLAAEDPVALGALGARFGVSKQRMGQIADQLKKRFRGEIVAKLGPDVRTDWLGAESD